ncbi:MAG: phosphodiesterase, partial [Oscillospiraceae bacterium]|nr:phosphodiesterase [Oscillospiraceae bacterium]
MKLMTASDIHGSAFYCSKLLDALEREGADRLLLLGDILYHGPRNALPQGYAPKETAEMLNGIKQKIFCIRGNCDAEVDQMMLEFPIMSDFCVLALGRRLIYATHGHRYSLASPPPLQRGDILLHGHTHVPTWERFGEDNISQNPSSVYIPKSG